MSNMNLFASAAPDPVPLPLPDATVVYCSRFFSEEESVVYYDILKRETPWKQDDIKVFGKNYKQPRLTALYGQTKKTYSYSGITMHPATFTETLEEIYNKISLFSEEKFNTVLLNLYRDGQDSNGWHSDDEKELGDDPIIASVSFGVPRVFHFRNKKDHTLKHKMVLENGSLLLMKQGTQIHWQHQLPKSKKVEGQRINLTFRNIL